MEKTVTIDGKDIPLKVTAGCVRMYKLQFRRDLIRDIFKMKQLENFMKDGEFQLTDEALAVVDFDVFMDLLWIFAKKADKTIPSPLEWEDQFESIPFKIVFPEVLELLTVLLDGAKKN